MGSCLLLSSTVILPKVSVGEVKALSRSHLVGVDGAVLLLVSDAPWRHFKILIFWLQSGRDGFDLFEEVHEVKTPSCFAFSVV